MPAPQNSNPWTFYCTSCGWSQESRFSFTACPECESSVIGTRETTEEAADWLIANHIWLRQNQGPDSDYYLMWVVLDGGEVVGAYETVRELMDVHGKATDYLVTQVL